MPSRRRTLLVACAACLAVPAGASAHPLAERTYDITLALRVERERAVVDYVLDVDPVTAQEDWAALRDAPAAEVADQGADFLAPYAELVERIVARQLSLAVDGEPESLALAAAFPIAQQTDHVRVHLRWTAPLPDTQDVAPAGRPTEHSVELRDASFFAERGFRQAVGSVGPGVLYRGGTAAPTPEQAPRLASWEWTPEQEDGLRRIRVDYAIWPAAEAEAGRSSVAAATPEHERSARREQATEGRAGPDEAGVAGQGADRLLPQLTIGVLLVVLVLAATYLVSSRRSSRNTT